MDDLPLKEKKDGFVQARVPQREIDLLKAVGVNIPQLIREAISEAVEKILDGD